MLIWRRVLNIVLILLASINTINGQDLTVNLVRGKVLYEDAPLAEVNIVLKNSTNGVLTDKNGNFSIRAIIGDTLIFSHIGMQQQIKVIDELKFRVPIVMKPEVYSLDEAVIKGYKPNLINDLANKPKTFNSIFGKEDLERKGYAVSYVNGDNLNLSAIETPGMPAIVNALLGKIANYSISPEGVILRSKNSFNLGNTALWEIDGVTFEGMPPPIPVSSVKDVFVLKGLAATTRYGSQGAGGVIVVRTHGDNSFTNQKLGSNSTNPKSYQGDALPYAETKRFEMPENDTELSALVRKLGDSAVAIRSLAYKFHASGDKVKALTLYRKVLSILPDDAQAYRDVALLLWEHKRPKEAWNMYMACLESNDGKFPRGNEGLVFHEMERLYVSENLDGKVSGFFATVNGFSPSEKGTARIILEWADPAQSFALEVVNPNGQPFETIFAPVTGTGQIAEEFFLDSELKGEWLFNIRPETSGQLPLLLKVTLFKDWFALGKLEKTIKIFEFRKVHENKYQLFNLTI